MHSTGTLSGCLLKLTKIQIKSSWNTKKNLPNSGGFRTSTWVLERWITAWVAPPLEHPLLFQNINLSIFNSIKTYYSLNPLNISLVTNQTFLNLPITFQLIEQ